MTTFITLLHQKITLIKEFGYFLSFLPAEDKNMGKVLHLCFNYQTCGCR